MSTANGSLVPDQSTKYLHKSNQLYFQLVIFHVNFIHSSPVSSDSVVTVHEKGNKVKQ